MPKEYNTDSEHSKSNKNGTQVPEKTDTRTNEWNPQQPERQHWIRVEKAQHEPINARRCNKKQHRNNNR